MTMAVEPCAFEGGVGTEHEVGVRAAVAPAQLRLELFGREVQMDLSGIGADPCAGQFQRTLHHQLRAAQETCLPWARRATRLVVIRVWHRVFVPRD